MNKQKQDENRINYQIKQRQKLGLSMRAKKPLNEIDRLWALAANGELKLSV